MTVPNRFCWTRFGWDAGQPIAAILERKEIERRSNNGVFYWGIGNALGPSIERFVAEETTPEVLFSPIKSKPRVKDVTPSTVLAWTEGRTFDGSTHVMPRSALVTSSGCPTRVGMRAHHALVCFSDRPIAVEFDDSIAMGNLRNFLSGKPLGASQVTAIASLDRHKTGPSTHTVAFKARLVPPYYLRLLRPIVIAAPDGMQNDGSAPSSNNGSAQKDTNNFLERLSGYTA